jgi:hypothetical protein
MASQTYQLVMRSGPTPGKIFPLNKDEIYIGRDINNDVVISDSEVSRKHSRMVLQAGGYVLEDLGSTNGTFVNGQRLMGPHLLRAGELLMLGENVSLTFEAGFDADATMVSAPSPVTVYPQPARQEAQPPPPRPEPIPPPIHPAPPPPAYSGQIPQGPPEPQYYEPVEPERRSNRNLIFAGCGCLLVALCLLLTAAFAFDSLNLYCTPPFNALSPLYAIFGGAPCP